MKYSEWEAAVPSEFRDDLLWRLEVYRLSLFLADIAWKDVAKLANDRRTRDLSNQLYRSVGSISANIAEGYSRSSGRDQARFYEYALGSARETRGWYYKGRHLLNSDAVQHRLQLLTQIIRLLLTIIPAQRTSSIQEEAEFYPTLSSELLDNIPY